MPQRINDERGMARSREEPGDREEKRMKKMAIMGFGTIGSGVFDVVNTNRDVLKRQIGEELEIKYVLDIRQFPGQPVEKFLTNDVNVILNDPEIAVVVETMGGIEPAFTFVSKALKAGKSVATSNKELVAARGAELSKLAVEKHVSFLFEASVGGGIPILRPLLTCLTADRIEAVTGILNGTTNYILTKMDREGEDFEVALRQAQERGYAERNPVADIEGHDACRKIAIIASIILTVLSAFFYENEPVCLIISIAGDVAEFFLVHYVIHGIMHLSHHLGKPELSKKGKRIFTVIYIGIIFEVIVRIIEIIYGQKRGEELALPFDVVANILKTIEYILFLIYIQKGNKMLKESKTEPCGENTATE